MGSSTNSVIIRYEPLRAITNAAITAAAGAYVAVGTPFANPARIIKCTNYTDTNLIISFDGITDHDTIAAFGYYVFDYSTNQAIPGGVLEQPSGTVLWVRVETVNPTLGNLYVTTVYASNV
jgi:hypothetical protein